MLVLAIETAETEDDVAVRYEIWAKRLRKRLLQSPVRQHRIETDSFKTRVDLRAGKVIGRKENYSKASDC